MVFFTISNKTVFVWDVWAYHLFTRKIKVMCLDDYLIMCLSKYDIVSDKILH